MSLFIFYRELVKDVAYILGSLWRKENIFFFFGYAFIYFYVEIKLQYSLFFIYMLAFLIVTSECILYIQVKVFVLG